ncbi:thiamine pyrophosphate-binding protein [Arthrobacter psychrochitiniphilus]|uniref:Acetolactate synthase n=1 Tax=Arthrobacter psychrochitiniphilus TaxID=291045 RepID=A0A2V3DV88_9MICC|nr:thiamine pyrophosphate-binding protein [Arthrobacter psychrochitiniphilus]NYG16668.1 acetolactate synthase-1/2/3 large subunit [Arthrobacter psychrochitiniphilus]PXA69221.1 acetolactate synthase [Arthrobacter psychrochitiniphilus]
MSALTGGEALVAGLAAHGVDTIFGIPGTHNLAAYAAMPSYGIKHISPRHEQGAGYAADGYARSSGRPGVVLTTTGPAILNAAAAAAQAYSDSIPVLFISPGMPLAHPGRGNGLLHEIKDQGAALAAVVAYSHRVTSVAEIPLAVAQAFAAMATGRPRPVHLEIPLDLLDEVGQVTVVPPVAAGQLMAPTAQIQAAAAALSVAQRPLLLVGGGASRAAAQVKDLAQALSAPVFATTNGKGIFPEDHVLAVGAGVQHPSTLAAFNDADAVVAIGTELSPADWWLGLPSLAGKLIRIDIDATSINTNAIPAHALVGGSVAVLTALLANLSATDTATDTATDAATDDAAASIAAQRMVALRADFETDAQTEGGPWLEIVDAIAAALPRDGIVAADSAMACYYGALSNLPLHRPNAFLYPTGVGTLGYGLPAGIGAKVANPEAPVLVLHGDGGIMFTIAELAMAAELRLALPIVIVDNGGYGEIRNEMADRGEPVHAVALGSPDFPALARALGCYGVAIANASELGSAIKTALDADRPTVLHIYEDSRAAADMLAAKEAL